MFLLNTDRSTLLPESVETNVCCGVLAGDKLEFKKGKKRHLTMFFSLPGIADETMMQVMSFVSFVSTVFLLVQYGQHCP